MCSGHQDRQPALLAVEVVGEIERATVRAGLGPTDVAMGLRGACRCGCGRWSLVLLHHATLVAAELHVTTLAGLEQGVRQWLAAVAVATLVPANDAAPGPLPRLH